MLANCVVLGGINFSRVQAGQQRLVRFRVVNPGPSQMIINSISLNSWGLPFLLPHLKDNAVFPIHLDPNTEYESIVSFCPTSEGKYSGFLTVSLDNARIQQINLHGECELPTSPSQILYNEHTTRTADSRLTEHGTYFDYSPRTKSPLTTAHATPHLLPPAPKNSPATPYVKTDAAPYLKTDNFYTRYNHIAGRAQNGWNEGGKDLETGPITEVVPYLSDSAGNVIALFESRLSKLEQNMATLLRQTTHVTRPQLHRDEGGEKEREGEKHGERAVENGYPFQTPTRSGNSGSRKSNSTNSTNSANSIPNSSQSPPNIPTTVNTNFAWSTLSNTSDKSNGSTKSNGSKSSSSIQEKREAEKNIPNKDQETHHTPYKPHQEHNSSELSDTSDNEFFNTKNNKRRTTTPYKPKKESFFNSSDDEELGSSHREILGSWKNGGVGDYGKYDEQMELAKSNSSRRYGEFDGTVEERGQKDDYSGRVRSGGKPIPQSFSESGENGNGKDEDHMKLTDEDKALLKEMQSSPAKAEGPSNWRDFITATPYAKNHPNLYQSSPVPNTPLPKRVHFGDGYSSA